MQTRRIISISILIFTLAASFAAADAFHFTVTADTAGRDAIYDRLLSYMQSKVNGQGAFQVSLGDLLPCAKTRARIDSRFGLSAVWYPVVGNHDRGSSADMTWFRDEYSSGHDGRLPLKTFTDKNGPAGCKETTYSWNYGNAHFVVLDEYWNGKEAPGSDIGADGDIRPELLKWLAADLAGNRKPVVFIFGHEPAYPAIRHVGDSLDKYPEHRDAFWKLLESDPKVKAFICGHVHYYLKYKKPKGHVWQIIPGNAGQAAKLGTTFADITVTDKQVTFNIWRDGGKGHLLKLDSWSVAAGQQTPKATLHPSSVKKKTIH